MSEVKCEKLKVLKQKALHKIGSLKQFNKTHLMPFTSQFGSESFKKIGVKGYKTYRNLLGSKASERKLSEKVGWGEEVVTDQKATKHFSLSF